MKRLNRKLRKHFYIETISRRVSRMELYKADYMVWYPNFITFHLFGKRYTFIFGSNYHLCSDITEANKFMDLQKLLYKTALIMKNKN